MLLVLLGLQSNVLPLTLTFGQDHDLSLMQQSGETYLVLGHKYSKHSHLHNHSHPHCNEVSLNHHHDSHHDHLIKLADYESIGIVTILNQIASFDHVIIPNPGGTYTDLIASVSLSYFDPIPERYRSYYSDQNSIRLKNSVQFLA